MSEDEMKDMIVDAFKAGYEAGRTAGIYEEAYDD